LILAPELCTAVSSVLHWSTLHKKQVAGGMVRARFKVKGEKDLPSPPSEFFSGAKGSLNG